MLEAFSVVINTQIAKSLAATRQEHYLVIDTERF